MLSVLLLAAAIAAQSEGSPPILGVLPVIAGDSLGLVPSDLVSAATAATRFRLAVRMSNLAGAKDDPRIAAILDCGAETKCVAEKLPALGFDRALLVVVTARGEEALLAVRGLRPLDVATAERTRRVRAEPAEILAQIEDLSGEVLDQWQLVEGGLLRVGVEPSDATITIAGVTGAIADGGEILLPPGKHRLHATRAGYADAALEVQIEPRRTRETQLSLSVEETSSMWSSPWLWLIVAGVAAAGTTAGILLSQPTVHCICIGGNCDC